MPRCLTVVGRLFWVTTSTTVRLRPRGRILAAHPGPEISWETSARRRHGGWLVSGTSFATLHVTGGAALIYSANPGFTPAQVAPTMFADATLDHITNPGAA